MLTLSHKSKICLLNFKSESIVIPRSLFYELDLIHVPSKCTSMGFLVLNRISHLPGLIFMWLLVNQEKLYLPLIAVAQYPISELQLFTKYLRQTLVFMWNSALRKKFKFFIFFFYSSFLLILTKFSLWEEDWVLGYNSIKF